MPTATDKYVHKQSQSIPCCNMSTDVWKMFFLHYREIKRIVVTFQNVIPPSPPTLSITYVHDQRNESNVGDIDFEILAKTVFKFFYCILFLGLASTNSP